jgi:hypothetical protein
MVMRKNWLALVLLSLSLSNALFASEAVLRTALPELDDRSIEALLAGETLDGETLGDGNVSVLAPVGSKAYEQALEAQAQTDGFSVASLSYIPYPEDIRSLDTLGRQLVLFNKMRALSTQVGITYISHRAGNKPKVLIEKCWYLADSRNLNNKLPDPVATTFPFHAESYVYQRDSTFGGNRYHHIYTNSEKEIFVQIVNVNSLKVFGIFKALSAGKLAMSMATYQLDDGLLLYSLASIADKEPQISVLGITVDLPSAFRRRISALQQWFEGRLYADSIDEGEEK